MTDLPKPHLCRPPHLLGSRLPSREEAGSPRRLHRSAQSSRVQPCHSYSLRTSVSKRSSLPTEQCAFPTNCCTCRAAAQPVSPPIPSARSNDRLLQSAAIEARSYGIMVTERDLHRNPCKCIMLIAVWR